MRRSSAELAIPRIIDYFDNIGQHVFTFSEIANIFEDQRLEWKLLKAMTTPKFIQFLIEQGNLTKHRFRFRWLPTTLFFWGSPHEYEIAMSLNPHGYLSHLTAMQYHNLIQADLGRVIYTNVEQSTKPTSHANLEQARIDNAFQRPPRVTRNRHQIEDCTYCLLSGKYTNMLEVISEKVPNFSNPIRVTSLERTLVDIVVRPTYSGGVYGILEAYTRAAKRVNVERVAEILDQLQYRYPYHQAIGFFLDQSHCYSEKQLRIFHRYTKRFDFYVDYEIAETKYSSEWRVHYPSYLDSSSHQN